MKDIYAIRRDNLAWVCKHKASGNQSELARSLEVPPNLVSRYLKNKPIGDDVARRTEHKYKLAPGWMDNVHELVSSNEPGMALPPEELELIGVYRGTDDRGRLAILAVARSQRKPDPTKRAANK